MSKPGPERSSLRVVARLWSMSPPSGWRLTLAVALGVAGAMATVGLLAGSGYVVDRAAFRPGLGAIAGVLASVEVLAFLRGPLRYGERLTGHDAAFRTLTGWRLWLYDRLEPLSPAGLRSWRSGDLLSRSIDDVEILGDLYLRVLLPVAVTVTAAVLATAIVAFILPLAAVVLGTSLLVALVAIPLLTAVARRSASTEASLRGRLGAEVVDLVQGAPDLLAFGTEELLLGRAARTDAELTRLARKRSTLAGAGAAVATLCTGGAIIGVLIAGVAAVHAHRMEPVMLAVLPLAAVAAFETIPALAGATSRFGDVMASARRLLDLEAVPVPVIDPDEPVSLPDDHGHPEVSMRDARLRYADDLPWALRGVDLDLPAGSRTAIIGASGAGKTSIVNVLLRYWPLTSGRTTVDGIPIERMAQAEVRRQLGPVDQDAHLFAGTIRQNILLSRPRATTDEVAKAVRSAQLDDWVATLPEGLDTPVGEHGSRVSGGQRQRIALARALLSQAQILLLDEPTSGLDHESARRLLSDTLAAAGDRTVLLITHRPEDLTGFDRVVEIDRGRVRPTR